jgi:hypothetical protein
MRPGPSTQPLPAASAQPTHYGPSPPAPASVTGRRRARVRRRPPCHAARGTRTAATPPHAGGPCPSHLPSACMSDGPRHHVRCFSLFQRCCVIWASQNGIRGGAASGAGSALQWARARGVAVWGAPGGAQRRAGQRARCPARCPGGSPRHAGALALLRLSVLAPFCRGPPCHSPDPRSQTNCRAAAVKTRSRRRQRQQRGASRPAPRTTPAGAARRGAALRGAGGRGWRSGDGVAPSAAAGVDDRRAVEDGRDGAQPAPAQPHRQQHRRHHRPAAAAARRSRGGCAPARPARHAPARAPAPGPAPHSPARPARGPARALARAQGGRQGRQGVPGLPQKAAHPKGRPGGARRAQQGLDRAPVGARPQARRRARRRPRACRAARARGRLVGLRSSRPALRRARAPRSQTSAPAAPAAQDNFERNSENGAFEEQYRRLAGQISSIYEGAKEFHQKG